LRGGGRALREKEDAGLTKEQAGGRQGEVVARRKRGKKRG